MDNHFTVDVCDDMTSNTSTVMGGTDISGDLWISIITSTYNAGKDLPWTIDSIRSQAYPYIQWIIADGGSDDNTLNLIKQNDDIVDTWFSEKDSGIYDAWNKAISYVKGEWVIFLGAGDEFCSQDTLVDIVPVLNASHPSHDLVYGKRVQITEHSRKYLSTDGKAWALMVDQWSGLIPALPPHPALFHHASLFSSVGRFNDSLKLAADAEFVLRVLRNNKSPLYVDQCITKMALGGTTGKIGSTLKLHDEQKVIVKKLDIHVPRPIVVKQEMKLYVKRILLIVLGEHKLRIMTDWFRSMTGRPRIWTVD